MSSPSPTNRQPDELHVADVRSQQIARVYAEALLNAAAAHGEEDAVLDELRALVADVFRERPEFEQFLASLAIGRDRKEAVIRDTFTGKASERFLNFLLVLNQHDRLELLRAVYAEAVRLREQRKGQMRVHVKSAVPLADAQRDRLVGELRALFGREPILHQAVDPDILGGLEVRVGDWLYDASVRTQYINIRNQLFESASHEIQSRRDHFGNWEGN
jgi:F-type H+-transporting ATPase subunit delta